MAKQILRFFLMPVLGVLALSLTACGGDDGLGNTARKSADNTTYAQIDSAYEYRLPVVFHVLYSDPNDTTQYISATRLRDLLQYVNELYKGNIYGNSEDTHITFYLATEGENGEKLATPGIDYVKYDGEYPIDAYSFMNDNSGKNVQYIWDPNKYINVMMYHFKTTDNDTELLGISHMPFTPRGNHALSGLRQISSSYISKSQLPFALCSSINSKYVSAKYNGSYYQSDRYTRPDHIAHQFYNNDIVVTIAHELGHYLGLFHAFTEGNSSSANDVTPTDSCGDTDYCKDTPSYNRYEYNMYRKSLAKLGSYTLGNLILRYACDGATFNATNIMDYEWTLGYSITHDQKERLRNVLYYSPLIPGPKKNGINVATRSTSVNQRMLNIKPLIIR